MKEYIEREAAIAFMNEVEPCICYNPDGVVFSATKDNSMLEFLRTIPAADVVPVRHGLWNFYDSFALECSNCGWINYHNMGVPNVFNYCPNCGAVMDKDGDG